MPPLVFFGAGKKGACGDARRRHHDRNRPQCRFSLVESRCDGFRVGDVELDGDSASAFGFNYFHRLIQPLNAAGGKSDFCARSRKGLCKVTPKP